MPIEVKRNDKGKIYSHIRRKWLHETPEERVRQDYLCVLVNEYGYSLDQIDEEISVTGRGSGDARADFLIWRSVQDRTDDKPAMIVVECKADNVSIDAKTYNQGANYAQYERAKFFVTHNNRETKYWRVDLEKRMPNYDEIDNIPPVDASDKQIEELMSKLKVFKEDEFADLLHKCHNIIRNREHLDPAAAFDEIAKILFVKIGLERRLRQGRSRQNLFTAKFLEEQRVIHDDPINVLFEQTKNEYRADRIFNADEKINLRHNTVKAIVEELEVYNLSDTSEDIKGIAFERFLGRTFRGEIGQFFTPRTIVEFMIRMLEPKEGDIICDPASGSGGFLIRFFELVRQQIMADADTEYKMFKDGLDNKSIKEAEKAKLLSEKFAEIEKTLDPKVVGSRMWKLSNRCIYGTDANDRMARTSKMNMIMHGDGHGGVHHHNGFLNVNGIFEGRFDIILTNPPFGANVEPTDIILRSDIEIPDDIENKYIENYGDEYISARDKIKAAIGKPIASLFELPKKSDLKKTVKNDPHKNVNKIKTEILFIERCLDLLKPGGRMGIVLPEGVFNNPSLSNVREFVENRAKLLAVVSLPQETFFSSGASVKASLLFLQKFTDDEESQFQLVKATALEETKNKYRAEMEKEIALIQNALDEAKKAKDIEAYKVAQKALSDYMKKMFHRIAMESRALLKERFDYPIFLYEAEKVGITATGEPDENELYDNNRLPLGIYKSALDCYVEFCNDQTPFFV